ncbi:MAG TPA: transposase [Candidatus Heimdallarchaeota archaeon]|nr:transposase [Candidatus Heimdallarchaeota archaeon]
MSKRRTFTPSFKAQVVLEVLTGVKGPAQACQEYGWPGD